MREVAVDFSNLSVSTLWCKTICWKLPAQGVPKPVEKQNCPEGAAPGGKWTNEIVLGHNGLSFFTADVLEVRRHGQRFYCVAGVSGSSRISARTHTHTGRHQQLCTRQTLPAGRAEK